MYTPLNNCRQRRLDEEPALIRAKESISQLITELREFKKEQATVTADLEQFKFKKTELGDKIVSQFPEKPLFCFTLSGRIKLISCFQVLNRSATRSKLE